jgi:predicted dehydrogenase
MGLLHAAISNVLSDHKLIAMCEKDRVLLTMGKKILPDVGFYETVDEMILKADPDVVFVTTPTHTHVPLIEQILSLNKTIAIFCEKPLACSQSDAARVASLAKDSISMVGFQKRFSYTFQKAKELLINDSLGELLFFRASYYVTDVFRKASGYTQREREALFWTLGPILLM